MKICLDAGHGTGQNQSPARCGYFEGDRMFTLQRLRSRSWRPTA